MDTVANDLPRLMLRLAAAPSSSVSGTASGFARAAAGIVASSVRTRGPGLSFSIALHLSPVGFAQADDASALSMAALGLWWQVNRCIYGDFSRSLDLARPR